jgi:hypothetical protein
MNYGSKKNIIIYMKEFKFFGIILFGIFCLILLVILIILITFIRFRCSEFKNHMSKINYAGDINNILPKLKTGDIILFGEKISEKHTKNKLKCFYYSRYNFTPNNLMYQHIGIVYKKNNTLYIIETIHKNDECKSKTSLVNSKYIDGLRIEKLDKIIKEYKESCKMKPDCCTLYGVRFLNEKFNQKELNRRIENEFNILSDTRFNNWDKVTQISIPGWFISDFPIETRYGIEIFFPNDKKDTFFCSEMAAALLQRIGLMKRTYRSRMFFPGYFTGFLDNKMFLPNTYSKIKIYK